MIDVLWENVSQAERLAVTKWENEVNELVRAYKNKEISRQKFTAWKKKYLKILDDMENTFSKDLQDQLDYVNWKNSWEVYNRWKLKKETENGNI